MKVFCVQDLATCVSLENWNNLKSHYFPPNHVSSERLPFHSNTDN